MSSPTRRSFTTAGLASAATAVGIALTVTAGLTAVVPITLAAITAWLWLIAAVRAEHEETRRVIVEQAEVIRQSVVDAVNRERDKCASAEDAASVAAELFDSPLGALRKLPR